MFFKLGIFRKPFCWITPFFFWLLESEINLTFKKFQKKKINPAMSDQQEETKRCINGFCDYFQSDGSIYAVQGFRRSIETTTIETS